MSWAVSNVPPRIYFVRNEIPNLLFHLSYDHIREGGFPSLIIFILVYIEWNTFCNLVNEYLLDSWNISISIFSFVVFKIFKVLSIYIFTSTFTKFKDKYIFFTGSLVVSSGTWADVPPFLWIHVFPMCELTPYQVVLLYYYDFYAKERRV